MAQLFRVMLARAAVIWALVTGAAIYAGRFSREPIRERVGLRLILWTGAIVPTLTLVVLLAYGLRLMPELRIEVCGEQFWGRVIAGYV